MKALRVTGSSKLGHHPQLLETFNPCAGAVLIFLSRATTNPAGADERAAAKDRHRTLPEKHVVALGHDNAAQRRMVGTWRQVTARTAEGGRRDSLALATVGPSMAPSIR